MSRRLDRTKKKEKKSSRRERPALFCVFWRRTRNLWTHSPREHRTSPLFTRLCVERERERVWLSTEDLQTKYALGSLDIFIYYSFLFIYGLFLFLSLPMRQTTISWLNDFSRIISKMHSSPRPSRISAMSHARFHLTICLTNLRRKQTQRLTPRSLSFARAELKEL